MCSAAHAWNGLGKIFYASSTAQLDQWRKEMGAPKSSIKSLAIQEVAPNVEVEGPVPELAEKIKDLHLKSFQNKENL